MWNRYSLMSLVWCQDCRGPVVTLETPSRHPVDTLGSWAWCQDCRGPVDTLWTPWCAGSDVSIVVSQEDKGWAASCTQRPPRWGKTKIYGFCLLNSLLCDSRSNIGNFLWHNSTLIPVLYFAKAFTYLNILPFCSNVVKRSVFVVVI